MNRFIVATLIGLGASSTAFADIVYTPVNPSFGGNPLNSNHLLSLADIQNQFVEDFEDLLDDEATFADQFIDAVTGAVIAGVAAEVTEAIFDDGAPPTGEFIFDDSIVTYVLDPGSDTATVTVNDGTTISTVVIPNPTTN